ncbi:MAG TPA: NAD(P)/FAD-dependent oxidoreductase [Bryobacteraceae bacterium]|jgi:NADH dehydrogenase
MPADLPHVVIVGGGFGGLYAARALGGAPVRITLIDKRNYHLFRPMLYQVATGLLTADEIAGPLRALLTRPNVEVLLDEVHGIDAKARRVHLRQHDLPYDFLILATGIQYNYFGHDEWQKIAPGLASLEDADEIRAKVLRAFESAENLAALGSAAPDAIQQLLTFVLVGAGTVGVEMASTLAEMSRIALVRDFRHIDPRAAQILLYEADSRVLPSYPEELSAKAKRHLEKLGVKVHTGTRVTRVDTEGIVAGGKRVFASTVLWSAGVLASPAGGWLGAAADQSGKILVNADFSVPGHPNIFAIGDTAHVVARSRNLVGIAKKEAMVLPGVAQPAIQEGRYVARVIRRRVLKLKPPPPFWYWDKGDLAIVGRTYAVADLRFLRFAGFAAWLVWALVHIYFLIGLPNRLFVLLRWSFAWVTKRRQVRIFTSQGESEQQEVKRGA